MGMPRFELGTCRLKPSFNAFVSLANSPITNPESLPSLNTPDFIDYRNKFFIRWIIGTFLRQMTAFGGTINLMTAIVISGEGSLAYGTLT